MPTEIMFSRPRLYRWMLRLLPLGVVVTVGAFALGSWAIVANISRNRDTTRQLQQQTARQQATIRLLCDSQYVVNDIATLFGGLVETPQERAALAVYQSLLIGPLLTGDSPCVG